VQLEEELLEQVASEGGDGSEKAQQQLAHTVVATAQVGTILLRMGQAEEALATFERARGIISTIKNPAQRYSCDKQVLHSSAMAASHLGRYEKSRELYETILAMAEAAGDKVTVADALHSLGMQYNLLKNAKKASEYLQRAMAEAGDADDTMIFNFANVQINQGMMEEGIANIRKALKALDSADGGVLPRRGENGGVLPGGGALDRENMREVYQLNLTKALYKAHKTEWSAKYSEEDIIKEAEAWLDLVLAASPACAVCRQAKGDNAGQLLTCGQCGVARYCSIDHQRLHWRPKVSGKPASDFADLESLKTALSEDPDRRPVLREGNAWVKTKISDYEHRRACRLYKKWKSVKKGQASREEARDEILAYLEALQIPMGADEADEDEEGTFSMELCGHKLEIPWKGPPPDHLLHENTFTLETGSCAGRGSIAAVGIDDEFEHVIVTLKHDPFGFVTTEIPIPMCYCEKDGISTGLFEDLLRAVGRLRPGLLPGKGNRFTQETRTRLQEIFDSASSEGDLDAFARIHKLKDFFGNLESQGLGL